MAARPAQWPDGLRARADDQPHDRLPPLGLLLQHMLSICDDTILTAPYTGRTLATARFLSKLERKLARRLGPRRQTRGRKERQ